MTAITGRELVQELRELIAALDRRVPHVERAGEALIARDAAALKARALKRIEDLEREEAVQPS
jgi:chorismate mutase